MEFGNTNPHCSTDPRRCIVPAEHVLLENDACLRGAARRAHTVIAAWGTVASPVLAARALRVLLEVADVYHMGLTKDGIPKHPLYLPKVTSLTLWRARESA